MLDIFKPLITTLLTPTFKKLGNKIANLNEPSTEVIEDTSVDSEPQIVHHEVTPKYNFDIMNSRLHYLVDELCTQTLTDSFNIDEIAFELRLSSTSELQKIFNLEQDCTFDLCKIFSEKYPINYNWLAFKKEQPFYSVITGTFKAIECLEHIKKLNPEKIYFFRDDSIERQIAIGMKISSSKFVMFSKEWHLSSHVGGTGRSQIYSFYELSKILYHDSDFFIKCDSFDISEELFDNLIIGTEPLSQIEQLNHRKFKRSYWWEDFIDLDCNASTIEKYGEEFVLAQKIVKDEINYYSNS